MKVIIIIFLIFDLVLYLNLVPSLYLYSIILILKTE